MTIDSVRRCDLFISIAWVWRDLNYGYKNEEKPSVLLCSLRMRMMSYLCNKYEQITTSYPSSASELKIHKATKELNIDVTAVICSWIYSSHFNGKNLRL